MHPGKDNTWFEYEMTDKNGNNHLLKSVENEMDSGIHVLENLKFDNHVSLTVYRADRLVGLIKRAFSYLHGETLLVLYKTIIRPILDSGSIIWFPITKRTYEPLKMFKDDLSDCFLKYYISVMKTVQMDMIQSSKFLKISTTYHWMDFFSSRTCPQVVKIRSWQKSRAWKPFRMNSFCVREVNKWIQLPEDIPSSFKTVYDRHIGDKKFQTDDWLLYLNKQWKTELKSPTHNNYTNADFKRPPEAI